MFVIAPYFFGAASNLLLDSANQHLSTVLYCDQTAKQYSTLQLTVLGHSSLASAFLQYCVQFNYWKNRAGVTSKSFPLPMIVEE